MSADSSAQDQASSDISKGKGKGKQIDQDSEMMQGDESESEESGAEVRLSDFVRTPQMLTLSNIATWWYVYYNFQAQDEIESIYADPSFSKM